MQGVPLPQISGFRYLPPVLLTSSGAQALACTAGHHHCGAGATINTKNLTQPSDLHINTMFRVSQHSMSQHSIVAS